MKPPTRFKFVLYVVNGTPNSARALANLHGFCRAHLPGQHEIEVVDVLKDPQRALTDAVFMTPMLIRLAPSPARRIVGTLSETQSLTEALGLETVAA